MIKNKRSFTFDEIIWEILNEDGIEQQDAEKILWNIVQYGITGIIPEYTPGLEKLIFRIAKRTIDSANANYNRRQENGKKGGAPKGNCNNPWGCKGKPLHLKVKSKSEPRTEENQQSNYDDGMYRNNPDYGFLTQSNNNNHIYEDTDLPDEDSQFPTNRLN